MIVPVHRGRVTEQRRIILENRNAFEAYLDRFVGKAIEIVVRRPIVFRMHSSNQQRYWRGVVVPMFTEAWNEAHGTCRTYAEMHHALVKAFIGSDIDGPLEFVPSSATFTTEQFTKLIDSTRACAIEEMDLFIPEPQRVEVA